jgi:hypothetical protein
MKYIDILFIIVCVYIITSVYNSNYNIKELFSDFNKNIYNNIDTNMYDKNTSYDKLVAIFNKPSENNNCDIEIDELKDLKKILKLLSSHLYIFNREVLPVSREFYENYKNNGSILQINQSAIDILNEKINKTCTITDIKNIEILKTENQTQYTSDVYINYHYMDKNNMAKINNLLLKIILIKRNILKDNIFAPNRYDSSKFGIKEISLIDSKNVNNKPEIINNENNYYDFNNLKYRNEIMNSNIIDAEMIKTRNNHAREMNFRNIVIEDNNYLNDYIFP